MEYFLKMCTSLDIRQYTFGKANNSNKSIHYVDFRLNNRIFRSKMDFDFLAH